MLNLHLFYRVQLLCAPGCKKCSYIISSTEFEIHKAIFPSKMLDEIRSSNQELSLRCLFSNSTNLDDIFSASEASWKIGDIKVIVPTNWKIVVTCNILIISGGNNESTRIIFRNPLKICLDYEKSNISIRRNNSGQIEIMPKFAPENNTRIINLQNINTVYGELKIIETTSKNLISKTNYSENAGEQYAFDPLPLEQPLLLKKCFEENKKRQVMLYKKQSISCVSGKQNRIISSKILEDLFKRSIIYEGDSIHLVFNPQKAIQILKRKERWNNNLICAHSVEAKLNLMRTPISHKVARNENVLNLNKQRETSKSFTSVPSKNAFNANLTDIFPDCRHTCKWDANAMFKKNFSDPNVIIKNELPGESNQSLHQAKKPKLKIRLRKKTRAALKRVNIRQIVSSVFQQFFHSYALLGGHLKSGAVITRSNSNYWLKVSGVATDSYTLRLAKDLFTAVAG